jgi:hypothetical protein
MAKAQPKRKRVDNVLSMAVVDSNLVTVGGSADIADADIARRAYALYLARGCEHGHDADDWFQAERELRHTAKSTAA